MDKDHLPLLEDQNPVRRSEIFAGTGSAKVAFTEAIKSLSNVSGREADSESIRLPVSDRRKNCHACPQRVKDYQVVSKMAV